MGGFLYINVAVNFLGYPQGIMESLRGHLKSKLPLDLGPGNPTKVQYCEYKMEGTETQYYPGGRTGSQRNWKVSDAELQCIIVSSNRIFARKNMTETWFISQFQLQKDH